ncbi:MAG: choice-of-anchor tandem repeat GloVer-containing protein [Candidatus Cybelea sp.]
MALRLTRYIIGVYAAAAVLAGCGNMTKTLPASTTVATARNSKALQTERVLYSFTGMRDGSHPIAGLTLDKQGNLYGTTILGGSAGLGTVFVLAPSSPGYQERVLYSFRGNPDGSSPNGGVGLDSSGTLYGTTLEGGRGYGTVFALKPSASGYAESLIHSFDPHFYGSDGEFPYSGVIVNDAGVLYGTTSAGGYGSGGIEILTPSEYGYNRTGWNFGEGNSGMAPYGGVVLGKRGYLYGTTSKGGNGNAGTVYEVTVTGNSFPTTIHSFSGPDGASPQSSLVVDKRGMIYGTTVEGGASNAGTVFRLSRHNRAWTEAVLHSFAGSTDGSDPHGAPLLGLHGIIYGTTESGGAYGNGTVYALTPSGTGYTKRTVYSFEGKPDGSGPMSGLILGKNGRLFGTTESGGSRNRGTVFEIRP